MLIGIAYLALFLAAGKADATLSDHGIVAFRQCHDKIVAACFLCCVDHFLLCCMRLTKSNIVPYRIMEQIYILKYHGNVG